MIDKRAIESSVVWGSTGLVPAVVQDAADGRVLMLAYMDTEALAATLITGEVHFHSRSRDRLWRKGETSGNVLVLRDIAVDCDGDALLLQVDPTGPACHLGKRSCFDSAEGEPEMAPPAAVPAPLPPARAAAPPVLPATAPPQGRLTGQGFDWLEELWATIDSRLGADPNVSYTARLLAGGVDAAARKVAEEAVEVVMGAKDDAAASAGRRQATRDALTSEVADLLYHTLVLLRERDLEPADVIARLQERHRP
jgi:phosphoribosyl-ATP pyrophosphohydrolase/phosphoribosyl-AMP cyclohydrolase